MKFAHPFLLFALISGFACAMEQEEPVSKKQKIEDKNEEVETKEVPTLEQFCLEKVARLPRTVQGLYKKLLPEALDQKVAQKILPIHPLFSYCQQEIVKNIQQSKKKENHGIVVDEKIAAALNHKHNKIALSSSNRNRYFTDIYIDNIQNTSDSHIATLRANNHRIEELAFNADATKLISKENNDVVHVWDVNSGQYLHQLTQHQNDDAFAMAINPAGTIVATAAVRGEDYNSIFEISLWNTNSGECVNKLMGHTNGIYSLIFSDDGKKLVAGSQDGTVHIWDIANGKCIRNLKGLDESNSICLALNHDGTKLIASDSDNMILYDVQMGKKLYSWGCHYRKIKAGDIVYIDGEPQCGDTCTINFNHDGTLFLSKEFDDAVRVFDVATGQCLITLENLGLKKIELAEFNADGTQIVGVLDDGSVYSCNIQPLYDLHQLSDVTTPDMIKLFNNIEAKKSNSTQLNEQEKEELRVIYTKPLDEQLEAMAAFMTVSHSKKYQLNAEEIKLFIQLPEYIQNILEPYVQFVDKDWKIKE